MVAMRYVAKKENYEDTIKISVAFLHNRPWGTFRPQNVQSTRNAFHG